ncbi:MAG: hypothetical protein ABI232_12985 [Jatrophihabitantaceae bacterium]
MGGVLPDIEDWDEDAEPSRSRALWAIVVLGCIALIVASLMVLLGGGSKDPNAGPGPQPLDTGTNAMTSQTATEGRTPDSTTATSSSSPAVPPASGDPCPAAKSCVVTGDGGAIAALNAFRTKNGVAPVAAAVTANAQTCAMNKGGGAACVPHYAWTSVPTQSGTLAITKIESFGKAWMLDPKAQSFNVGWAYVGGQYNCVLLKSP